MVPWFRPEQRSVIASHYAYVFPAAVGDPRTIAEQIRCVLLHARKEDREEVRCYSDLVGDLRARYRASASVEEFLAFLGQALPIAGDAWEIGSWLLRALHVAGDLAAPPNGGYDSLRNRTQIPWDEASSSVVEA